MRIGPLVTKPPVMVAPRATLSETARQIFERRVGSAVVIGEGAAYGIFTERDLLRGIAAGANPLTTTVAEYMTPNAVTVTEAWEVIDAARLMIEHRFRHLVVLDDAGQLTGILSLRNMVRALFEERQRIAAG